MSKNQLRVVLDTNVLVRAVSGRSLSSGLFEAFFNQMFTICLSTEILLEYQEKLMQIYDAEVAELVVGSIMLMPNVVKSDIYYDLRLTPYNSRCR